MGPTALPSRSMSPSFLYAATRTPFGRYGGALSGVRPDDLAATALTGVLDQVGDLDPALIDDVVWGCANQAGEDNRNVGRMAVLLAGLPTSVPATTVNRLCGSSLDAAIAAARAVETGDADVVVAGGVESMTRSPWVLPKPSRAFPAGDAAAVSTTLGWRLVNDRMPAEWTVSLGAANEDLADRLGISRDRQDAFAARSHVLADEAWTRGFYDDLVVPVPGADLARDECIRPGSTPESLGALRPAFRPDGTITAGNASPLNDGASAVIIGSEAAAGLLGRAPIARIAGRGVHALDPQDFGLAPVEAANKALARAGIGWGDVAAVELNEAFAVQSLACVDAWGIDPEIVNAQGGAIAIGHPLGASGARLLGTLAKRLSESGRALGRGGDLHRRRAGPRRRAGERVMTTICAVGGRGRRRSPGRLDRAGQRLRHGRDARAARRRAHRPGGRRPHGGVEQRGQRRHRTGRAARHRPGPQGRLLLPPAVRLVGLRRPLPIRARSSWRSSRRAPWPSGCAPQARASPPSSAPPARARCSARARRRARSTDACRSSSTRSAVTSPSSAPTSATGWATWSTARPHATSGPSWPPPPAPRSCRSTTSSRPVQLDPETIVTPSIFVDRVVAVGGRA